MKERIKKIRALKSQTIIADTHHDLAFDILRKREFGAKKVIETDYLKDIQKGGVNLIVSSIFVEDRYLPEMGLKEGLRQVEALLEDIEESKNQLSFCKNASEIKQATDQGKIAFMLSFEGIEPIGKDLSLLRLFKRLGVLGVGLCWSRRNEAADGADFKPQKYATRGGLTSFGLNLLEAIQKENMFLDLSHINDAGFEDVLNHFEGKLMVSHTNARALNETERNIRNDQIKKIRDKKGFIGVNAMNFTVSDGTTAEDINAYCDHIHHILTIGGEDLVGFGFDFNDGILRYVQKESLEKLPRKPFDCVKGYKDVDKIIENFIGRGYSDQRIRKIMGQNFINFLERK